jgi:ribonuclease BN (tRNA processing enzyme)
MKILQLGNGGGLDPLSINSSFLIDVSEEGSETEYLLFDCGYNIMQRLLELEENNDIKIKHIKHVYISHVHDDHVGNLETLIYWQYFKNNIKINVYSHSEIKLKNRLKQVNHIFNGSQVKQYELFVYNNLLCGRGNPLNGNAFIKLYPIKGFHGSTPSYGLIIEESITNDTIFISGDTKADSSIEKVLKDGLFLNSSNCLVFHDYSNWDCPSKNVHACKTDFRDEYSEEFKKVVIKYHNNEPFYDKWRTLS